MNLLQISWNSNQPLCHARAEIPLTNTRDYLLPGPSLILGKTKTTFQPCSLGFPIHKPYRHATTNPNFDPLHGRKQESTLHVLIVLRVHPFLSHATQTLTVPHPRPTNYPATISPRQTSAPQVGRHTVVPRADLYPFHSQAITYINRWASRLASMVTCFHLLSSLNLVIAKARLEIISVNDKRGGAFRAVDTERSPNHLRSFWRNLHNLTFQDNEILLWRRLWAAFCNPINLFQCFDRVFRKFSGIVISASGDFLLICCQNCSFRFAGNWLPDFHPLLMPVLSWRSVPWADRTFGVRFAIRLKRRFYSTAAIRFGLNLNG